MLTPRRQTLKTLGVALAAAGGPNHRVNFFLTEDLFHVFGCRRVSRLETDER